jgi:hypothetical protein
VLALALEAGAFVALSLTAFGALRLSRESGLSARLRTTWALPPLLTIVMGLAQLVPRGTEHPGAFANQLVRSAQGSCGASDLVVIPLLGLRVRCAPGQRIEGPVPGVRGASLSLRDLQFADDLRRVEMSGLELHLERSLEVRLHVESAKVSGLAPWSRSSRLSPLERFALMSVLGLALWLAVAVGPRVRPPREGATDPPLSWQLATPVLGAIPGVVLAGGCIMLDQDRASTWAYGLLALGAASSAWSLAWLMDRGPRFLSNFR